MTPIEMVDMVGNPLAIGDKVATDTISYKRSALRVGEITEITEGSEKYGPTLKVTYVANGTKRSVHRFAHAVAKVVTP